MNRYLLSFIRHKQLLPLIYKQPAIRYSSMLDKLPTIIVQPEPLVFNDAPLKKQKTSRAMKQYLEKLSAYKKFMEEERGEFEIGRRHLANMMGRDPENFTQEDIDESIEYLFPCGLYQKRARPMMKPPEVIFPPRKEAAFDDSGRPYHFLFYTNAPNFYEILHESVKMLESLYDLEDKVVSGEENPQSYSSMEMKSMKWLSKKEVEKKINEQISNKQYDQMINLFNRIAEHPYSSKVQNHLTNFAKYLTSSINVGISSPLLELEDGKKQVEYESKQKRSIVNVRVTYPGTGEFTVDEKDLHYFSTTECKEQVLFPLVFSKLLNKVDVQAKVLFKSGESAVTGAIRHGISLGLAHFVDEQMKEKMRLAGLLQREVRRRERKKAGQWGARRKFTWKKR